MSAYVDMLAKSTFVDIVPGDTVSERLVLAHRAAAAVRGSTAPRVVRTGARPTSSGRGCGRERESTASPKARTPHLTAGSFATLLGQVLQPALWWWS